MASRYMKIRIQVETNIRVVISIIELSMKFICIQKIIIITGIQIAMQEFVEKEWVEMPYIDIETTTMIKFGDTKTNLETAIAGEYEEWADMYPEFAKVAEEEWYPQFAARIKAIMVAEKHHEERYKKLHDLVKDDLVFKREEEIYWTCTKCGYVWKGKEPPKVCPLCGHDQGYYVKMNEDF